MVKAGLRDKLIHSDKCFMAVYLLEERAKPVKDQWAGPYIDMLPKDFSNFPIFFNEEDLKYLKGTEALCLL